MSKTIVAPFVRNPYNYDLKEASDSSGLDCSVDGPGRTKQSFKEEADINTLIKRFGIGNPLPTGARIPSYGDFTQAGDYQTALNVINEAERAFYAVPADVRARFLNDPARFVEFFNDEQNYPEAVRLGLVPPDARGTVPPAPAQPSTPPVDNPPASPVK